jgi:hypothetical protein
MLRSSLSFLGLMLEGSVVIGKFVPQQHAHFSFYFMAFLLCYDVHIVSCWWFIPPLVSLLMHVHAEEISLDLLTPAS